MPHTAAPHPGDPTAAVDPRAVAVALERGRSRCFALALDRPGWARAGRTPEAALEALAAYADRYRDAMAAGGRAPAGLRLPAGVEDRLVVVETLDGDATTDFGAPSRQAAGDARPTTAADGRRLAGAVSQAWATLDAVAGSAPAELRKGPRGGGRDRDAVVAHVVAAEASYARKAGVRIPSREWQDAATLPAARRQLLAALAAPADGSAPQGGWPPRYAARRIAWHVLDHAWEIQDRSGST